MLYSKTDQISQGSVATRLRYDAMVRDLLIANFL